MSGLSSTASPVVISLPGGYYFRLSSVSACSYRLLHLLLSRLFSSSSYLGDPIVVQPFLGGLSSFFIVLGSFCVHHILLDFFGTHLCHAMFEDVSCHFSFKVLHHLPLFEYRVYDGDLLLHPVCNRSLVAIIQSATRSLVSFRSLLHPTRSRNWDNSEFIFEEFLNLKIKINLKQIKL